MQGIDRAAIKFRGVDADINFDVSDYEDDLKQVSYCCHIILYVCEDFEY